MVYLVEIADEGILEFAWEMANNGSSRTSSRATQ
jgi:hypothetical protein